MKYGLNVGSGQRRFDSTREVKWTNVDSVAREGHEPDVLCDGAHLPYSDGMYDYFVLHHVLEHFGCGEAEGLVREAHRVLRPGGSLLIFIPDVRELAKRWLAGELDDYLFMVNMMGAYMGDEADRHKWHYTREGIVRFLLQTADWQGIRKFDWRVVPGADFARDWWIFACEAIK